MKLKYFIDNLNKFIEANPKSLECIVISRTRDYEGFEDFETVDTHPTEGIFNEYGYTVNNEYFKQLGYDTTDINAVCIN